MATCCRRWPETSCQIRSHHSLPICGSQCSQVQAPNHCLGPAVWASSILQLPHPLPASLDFSQALNAPCPLPPPPSIMLVPLHSYVIEFLNKLHSLQLLGFWMCSRDPSGSCPSTSCSQQGTSPKGSPRDWGGWPRRVPQGLPQGCWGNGHIQLPEGFGNSDCHPGHTRQGARSSLGYASCWALGLACCLVSGLECALGVPGTGRAQLGGARSHLSPSPGGHSLSSPSPCWIQLAPGRA